MVGMDEQPQDLGRGADTPFASRLNGLRNGTGERDWSHPGQSAAPSNEDPESRTAPDMSGHDRLRPDVSGHLSVRDAQVFLFSHGLPRNERSIRRYCNNGTLTCMKIDTATGREWVVQRDALEIYLHEQLQFIQQEGGSRTAADTSGHDRTEPDMSGQLPAPVNAIDTETKDALVEALRDALSEAREQMRKKDEQIEKQNAHITSMLERDRETNVLIQNLQRMVLHLQAPNQPPDADTSGHDRRGPDSYGTSSR